MTIKQRMRIEVDDLELRVELFRDAIAIDQPQRLATAQKALEDTRRVRWLIRHSPMKMRDRVEVVGLLKRAMTLVDALGNPVQ